MDHDTLLRRYILSNKSPRGDWHVNVPAGMQIVEQEVSNSNTNEFSEESFAEYAMNRAKEIDAICVLSQTGNRDLGWNAWDRNNIEYYEGDVFNREQVLLVEAKPSNQGVYKGLGQLELYAAHINQYWNCNSLAKVLILPNGEIEEFTEEVRDDLDTRIDTI